MPKGDEAYYKLLEDNVETSLLDYDNEIQLSIAISLKRIADKLELSQKQPTVMTAEEALNYYKLCDGC
jgi:hypothetical protein